MQAFRKFRIQVNKLLPWHEPQCIEILVADGQLVHNVSSNFLSRGGSLGRVPAALQDGLIYQTASAWSGNCGLYRSSASRFAENCYVTRVAAERLNIVSDPLQDADQILHA